MPAAPSRKGASLIRDRAELNAVAFYASRQAVQSQQDRAAFTPVRLAPPPEAFFW